MMMYYVIPDFAVDEAWFYLYILFNHLAHNAVSNRVVGSSSVLLVVVKQLFFSLTPQINLYIQNKILKQEWICFLYSIYTSHNHIIIDNSINIKDAAMTGNHQPPKNVLRAGCLYNAMVLAILC